MSPKPRPDVAEQTIEIYSSVIQNNYCSFAMMALVLYDFVVTFEREYRLFWRRRFTVTAALFCTIRYWLVLNYIILVAASLAPFSDSSCGYFIKVQFAFAVTQYMAWGAFSALRVFALSGMNWALAAVVFLLSIAPSVVNFIQFGLGVTGSNVFDLGCQGDTAPAPTPTEGIILSVFSRSALVIADALVIAVTIMATRRGGLPRIRRRGKASLTDVLIYDGIRYFAVLVCLNVLQVILTHLSIDVVSQQGSYIVNVSDPLTGIFICRFMLDLQAANEASRGLGSHTGAESFMNADSGTLHFASQIVGTMGGATASDMAVYADEERDGGCEEEGERRAGDDVGSTPASVSDCGENGG